MKVVYSKILPIKGYFAMNLFGVCFIRKEYKGYEGTTYMESSINHESIHTCQILDFTPVWMPQWLRLTVGGIIFYLLYFLEWIFRLLTPPMKTAYRDISFEREAYHNDNNFSYIEGRKRFSWIKYIKSC